MHSQDKHVCLRQNEIFLLDMLVGLLASRKYAQSCSNEELQGLYSHPLFHAEGGGGNLPSVKKYFVSKDETSPIEFTLLSNESCNSKLSSLQLVFFSNDAASLS